MPAIEPFYELLGRRVSQYRNQAGLSQEQLGKKLAPRMTRASVANIENGRQRVLSHTLVQLAAALGVDLMTLVPSVPASNISELAAELKRKLPSRAAQQMVEAVESITVPDARKEGKHANPTRTKPSRTPG